MNQFRVGFPLQEFSESAGKLKVNFKEGAPPTPKLPDSYSVILRKSGGKEIVKGDFLVKEEAESFMSDLDEGYKDSPTSCLWLVENRGTNREKVLYGYK
jgi:hypothetical protein